jgi:hypothetical protein
MERMADLTEELTEQIMTISDIAQQIDDRICDLLKRIDEFNSRLDSAETRLMLLYQQIVVRESRS